MLASLKNFLSAPRWRLAAFWLALACTLTACTAPKVQALSPPPVAASQEARCAASGGTWDTANFKNGSGYCAKGTETQCMASGGNWQRVCMMGTLACVQAYADAGKTCCSGSDCRGQRCLQTVEASGSIQPQAGRCIANNNPCYFGINLENGLPVPTAVID